jgi:hypothetical protein
MAGIAVPVREFGFLWERTLCATDLQSGDAEILRSRTRCAPTKKTGRGPLNELQIPRLRAGEHGLQLAA